MLLCDLTERRQMNRDLSKLVGHVLDSSEFLAAIRALRPPPSPSRLFGKHVRHLSKHEVAVLEAQGNCCDRWDSVLVARGFVPETVSHSSFFGTCVLGAFGAGKVPVDSGLSLPSGILNSIVVDSEIGTDSLVYNSTVVRYVVGRRAVVFSVGTLQCTGATAFGNGTEIRVGIETGGREIFGYADLTMSVARAVAFMRDKPAFLAEYSRFVKAYVAACRLPVGVVAADSVVRRAVLVRDAFLSPGCVIDGATLVENATVLCSLRDGAFVGDGAIVKNSSLQWGCSVSSMAIVDHSVLAERCAVERHAKITNSIIGQNTHVAEGEITASLVGPFVGFHHQAMLIGALWPEGKGNVASGANVGSNHTSRAPDQELWCGEGMFFGLGVNVKYPANFAGAPYTIVATGVTLGPQKLEFPFSLINSPASRMEGIRPYLNEVLPAWVLSDNIYAVLRNEVKFEQRNKATRASFAFETLRPDIMDLIVRARDRIGQVAETRPWYDESTIEGLGQNYLTEQNRLKGIAAYNFFIEYYCLRGLYRRCTGKTTASVYRKATSDTMWEHQRTLLKKEGFAGRGIRENLCKFIDIQETVARSAAAAKEKDDARGRRIFDDYNAAHVPARADSFVTETFDRTKRMKTDVKRLLSRL